MKVVFCIDDNPRYLLLLKVAVRSLRALHGPDAPCLCVYAGDKQEVLEGVTRESIPLARYRPRLSRDLLPPETHANIGCFLKLELALVPELAGDEAVLYCDADMLFQRPLDALFNGPLPLYIGMAPRKRPCFTHEYESCLGSGNSAIPCPCLSPSGRFPAAWCCSTWRVCGGAT